MGSYQQTLDCPALSGLRDVDDVIAGHQAVGIFDPQLWSVVVENGRPLWLPAAGGGTAARALELVYLGLSPEKARGRGFGAKASLMEPRAGGHAARRHFAVMSLAVDEKNVPALALYRRCGYRRVRRAAWLMIKTLGLSEELQAIQEFKNQEKRPLSIS